MAVPKVNLINLMAHPFFYYKPTELSSEHIWKAPSSGYLFLVSSDDKTDGQEAKLIGSTKYATKDADVVVIEAYEAPKWTTLNTKSPGYQAFQHTVQQARENPNQGYHILVTYPTARFLAEHPDTFEYLKNIRIVSCGTGRHCLRGANNTPFGYTSVIIHHW